MADAGVLRVTVVVSPGPRAVDVREVLLPAGATVEQAIQASGLLEMRPAIDLQAAGVGIWGRKAGLGTLLRDRDRVEIYGPLRVDPKVARRERFKRQGTRGTGLFSKPREGGKPGY
jgi:uncharacterized protein